ncbi:MAG TPA: DUF5666 domain-containing protein [Ramlibacter sp.]|nr:DUF5666 domain-containing protein [Ramlibacter sp.]
MKNSCMARARAWRMLPLTLALAFGLAACGGGGSGTTATATATPTPTAAAAPADSSGAITAFGSVFVNGHEFNTNHARLIDDDTGAVSAGTVGLEVGMVVDVKPDASSTPADPVAAELHVHPLARGYVDAADATAGTITVMGQTVQLTSATMFSDHRACVSATTSPCTPVATAAGLTTSTVSGTTTTPGSYVSVNGYLFGTSSSAANIVATLVSVGDAPTGSGIANFKAEGSVTVGTSTVTIGALKLDLSKATCIASGEKTSCSGAFSTGDIVSAGAAAAPALPATTLVADFARLVPRMPVATAGASVEVEGAVSSAGTSTFVVRGLTIDASALPAGTAMPGTGDIVRVLGTVSASGQSVTASSLTIEHAANSVNVGLQGDAGNVAPGTTTGTFTVSVLGQTITVNAQTRLADMSVGGWDRRDPAVNPFNITTFQTYLTASTSKHVLVAAQADSTGALVARSLVIVPASTVVSVAGTVDATPAVVNSTTTGTPTTFSVHGIAVSADPAAIIGASAMQMMMRTSQTAITAGDQVLVVGALTGSVVTVGPTLSSTNAVVDAGTPGAMHEDRDIF